MDECVELESLLLKHDHERAQLTKTLRNDNVLKGSEWPNLTMVNKNPAVMKFVEPELLGDFALNDGESARQEFWIADENAKMALYEDPGARATYMRIHSLDSHAANLAQWAIFVSLMVSKQLSMTFVVVELRSKVDSWQIFWAFVCLYSGSLAIWVASAAYQANKQLTITGDFVTQRGFNFSYLKLFFVIVFLEMACVPREIAESPVSFHVRKMVQPFAVLKKDGKRVWVTGYMHKSQYEMEQRRAFRFQAPMLLVKDGFVLGVQIWLGFHESLDVALVYAIASGIAALVLDMCKFYWATKYWNEALNMLKNRKEKLEERASGTMAEDDGTKVQNELQVVKNELDKMT